MKVIENCPIKDYTTFGIDAIVKKYVEADNNSEIIECLQNNPNLPVYIIGGGSNIIFTSDFNGIILHPAEKKIETIHQNSSYITLRVSAGVEWYDLVNYTVSRGYGGLENLSLIPGNVGACPVQNIGAYGVEVKDTIIKVDGIYLETLQPFEYCNEECKFGYRDSIFKNSLKGKVVITHVTFMLDKMPILKTNYGNIEEELKKYSEINIQSIRKAVISIRERKLPSPKEFGNCGSFFKNPTILQKQFVSLKERFPDIPSYSAPNDRIKIPAAWLIEQCGFKGIRKGSVGIHSQQALVIINLGNATGQEVVKFSDEIIEKVKDHFGILLEKEVNLL